MPDIKTLEEFPVNLCKYCKYGDIQSSIHWMCEGRWCEDAYLKYLEQMEEDAHV
jgi:hypothetical protein